jgi:ATP-dependent protease ClpP protease subunit/phage head maturation protease
MAESPHRRALADLVDSTAARIVEQATTDDVPVAELPGMRLRWYHIGVTRAADPGTTGRDGEPVQTEANVYVYDHIGGSMGVNASQFAADLGEIDADVINLRINSPGGSVFDAKAIMNTLRAHPAYVHAHIDGMAASAASVVMLGADTITVEPGGEVMVHRASSEYSGDDLSAEAWTTWLRRQTEDIAGLYSQRSGRPADEWDALMTAETWFYGQEAVDHGLADKAVKLTQPVPAEDAPAVAERMARRHHPNGYKFSSRADAGPPRAHRKAATVTTTRAARGRVPSEVRDAGQLRRRAMDRGMMRRTAPAGVTTMARRSAPAGDITHSLVEHRGRSMYETTGMFTVYGRGYEMWDMYGPYQEKVFAGSGADTMGGQLDCIFLQNHAGLSMARTGGPWNQNRGTLWLEERDNGGYHRAYLNPDRDDVRNMILSMDDGQMTEMSYAFLIVDGRWNDDLTEYGIYLYDMNRGDVSGVNYGANPFTDITARASEILGELEQMPAGAIGEAVRILSQRVGTYEQLLRDADPGALARIAEPALERARDRGPATAEDVGRAEEWLDNAFASPAANPEPVKVIDNTPADGPTVAGYEALAASLGIKLTP